MISFIEIDKNNEKHIKELFLLLKKRKFNISNNSDTDFDNHREFVIKNPYRKWSFIKKRENLIGTFYINYENFIGINLIENKSQTYYDVIRLILTSYKPLPEIKSVRNKYFLFNTNPNNKKYIIALEELGMVNIQKTYLFKN